MKKVVFTFGRFNPITVGHAKLIEKVIKLSSGADHRIYASHTEDNSKNPLPYERKVSYLRKLFPQANITTDPKAVTVYAICRILSDQGYKNVTLVVGGDRISDFEKVRSYIRKATDKDFDPTKHYLFEKFNIVSAGERTGNDTIAAASGTKMREYARQNDFDSFLRDTPTKNVSLARDMFRDVQKKVIKEDLVNLAEGVNDHGIFKAVFMAGGPGSGKDFIAAKLLGGTGLVEINSDVAFEMLMKKNNISMIMDKEDPKRDAFLRMHKQFRLFIAGPIHRKEAQDWIKKELSTRNIQQYAGVPKSGSFGKSRPNQMGDNDSKPKQMAAEDQTDENYINTLKEEFAQLETLSLDQYGKIRNVLKTLDEETLELFADSDIKFVSHLARNRIR